MTTLAVYPTKRTRGRRGQTYFNVLLRLCEQLSIFIEEYGAQNAKAYLTLDTGELGLYLVTDDVRYNFELSEKLAEFSVPYIQRGLLGSVSLLPASTSEELAAYFDPKRAIRVELGERGEHA